MNDIEILIVIYGTVVILLQGEFTHMIIDEIKKLEEILDDRERIL